MATVAVIPEKGGVGKTTMALTLAVAAVGAGRKVAVFDHDPQATAAQWTDRRKNEFPLVVATPAARDLVLVPVEPHLYALETLPKLADVLHISTHAMSDRPRRSLIRAVVPPMNRNNYTCIQCGN